MLILLLYSEICEYQNKYKNIVDTQRILDYIPGQKFKSFYLAEFKKNENIEKQGKGNPDSAPYNSLFNRYSMCFFMKNPKVKGKDRENKDMESNPEIEAHDMNFSLQI
jgi:hypothetical protein